MATTIETGLHAGNTRTIVADAPAVGFTFDQWIGDVAALANAFTSTTLVTMPSGDVTVTATYIPVREVVITFNDINNADAMIGGSSSSVGDWNAYWDLPVNGNPFTSVEVNGNVVRLKGGSNINMKFSLFDNNLNSSILSVVDATGCIISATGQTFGGFFASINMHTLILPAITTVGDYFAFQSLSLVNLDVHSLVTAGISAFDQCSAMTSFNLPVLVSAGNYCFAQITSVVSYTLPSLITAGDYCFYYNYVSVLDSVNLPIAENIGDRCFLGAFMLTNIYIPSCLFLGTTVLDNFVFYYVEDLPVTLTIPTALMTCNAGSPDGDITFLQIHAGSLTIIQV